MPAQNSFVRQPIELHAAQGGHTTHWFGQSETEKEEQLTSSRKLLDLSWKLLANNKTENKNKASNAAKNKNDFFTKKFYAILL